MPLSIFCQSGLVGVLGCICTHAFLNYTEQSYNKSSGSQICSQKAPAPHHLCPRTLEALRMVHALFAVPEPPAIPPSIKHCQHCRSPNDECFLIQP